MKLIIITYPQQLSLAGMPYTFFTTQSYYYVQYYYYYLFAPEIISFDVIFMTVKWPSNITRDPFHEHKITPTIGNFFSNKIYYSPPRLLLNILIIINLVFFRGLFLSRLRNVYVTLHKIWSDFFALSILVRRSKWFSLFFLNFFFLI